jgi:phospholipase/carboxylesterase
MRKSTQFLCSLLLLLVVSCGEGTNPMPPAPPDWIERVMESRQTDTGRQPPLLVLLHGIGADENDLFPIAQRLDPRFTVVSLRAPRQYAMGYSWFQIDFAPDGTVTPQGDEARESLANLVRWLEAAPERHNTDPARTYLLGFSQGAMMSLGILLTAPQRAAGVVALSGRSPHALFEQSADQEAIGRVPLFVAHGTLDDVLPIANGRDIRDRFSTVSTDLTYQEYAVGHGISLDELALVGDWLTARLDMRAP